MGVSRMCAFVSAVIPVLEAVVVEYALPSLLYLCEVTEDGSVLAGVELELPGDGSGRLARREFFWSSAWCGFMNAYEQAALQAIRFLQSLYGFVVHDYNYDCMMAYRRSARSSIVIAVSAVRHIMRLERELLHLRSAPANMAVVSPTVPAQPRLD
jgi:hypothetical protein